MSDKKSKLAAGSIINLLGSIILRLGGFIYRFILSRLLTTTGYGIVGLTLPFQNALITGASGGVPPAIAKYVAQYNAIDEKQMMHQIIVTSVKLMIFMAFIASTIMFIISEPVAIGMWHKPEVLMPLRIVSLIVPFSVLAGAIRGVFQGFYNMKDLFYSKFLEQIFTLIFAVGLVLLGWYASGAVLGTALGFLMSLIGSYYLYCHDIRDKYIVGDFEKIPVREELKILFQIFKFAVPVVITGIAEIFIYDTGTFFIGMFMPTMFAGFYTNASALSRIPLMLSNAVSTSVLPATSEADSLQDKKLLELYIHQSFRYTTLTTLPMSAIIMVFATPIISLFFGAEYAPGADALWILVGGMFFFSLYLITSSMCQGLGKPQAPMYALIIGSIINIVGSYLLIPIYGISGAAFATTIATFVLMASLIARLTQISGIHIPYLDIAKLVVASVVMVGVLKLFPANLIGMIFGSIIGLVVYFILVLAFKAVKRDDLGFIDEIVSKSGPLRKFIEPVADIIYDHAQ